MCYAHLGFPQKNTLQRYRAASQLEGFRYLHRWTWRNTISHQRKILQKCYVGNTHCNLICIKYLCFLSTWAEAKELWGKTLLEEILKVPLIFAYLHSPSVEPIINRKERRDCLHYLFFFYNGCNMFLCRLRTFLLLNTVARNINFLIGMLYTTLWLCLRYRDCFKSILYKPTLILYLESFCNEICKMWLYKIRSNL